MQIGFGESPDNLIFSLGYSDVSFSKIPNIVIPILNPLMWNVQPVDRLSSLFEEGSMVDIRNMVQMGYICRMKMIYGIIW